MAIPTTILVQTKEKETKERRGLTKETKQEERKAEKDLKDLRKAKEKAKAMRILFLKDTVPT